MGLEGNLAGSLNGNLKGRGNGKQSLTGTFLRNTALQEPF